MLALGQAKKIIIHINEDTSARHDFLSGAILSLLLEREVAGATVIRPSEGFGSHHRIRSRDGDPDSSRHLPVRIEFIDTAKNIDALLPRLRELVTDGVIEAHDVEILWAAVGTES